MPSGIMVSGYEADFVAFKAPSGQWNVDLDAYLVSVNATFGFNLTPHKFSLQFIPTEFNGASGELPEIGTLTDIEIRQGSCQLGCPIKGYVTHADYQNSAAGTVLRVEIEDCRKEVLDVIKLSTEDLGGDTPSGIVSVAEMYRRTTGFVDLGGDIADARVKEYRNISEFGATYQQIYEALIAASGFGITVFDPTIIPHPNIVAANTQDNLEPIRWKFSTTSLSKVISTVLSDTSYDWYWGMKDGAVKVVNRKVTFDVNENTLSVQQLTPDSTDFKFGVDKVQSPSKVTVFGAHQEGFLNSDLLSSIDGIDTPAGVDFTFVPAWTGISVSFIDAFGVYRDYKPTEKELQMAQKSIEHWTYYKLYQDSVFGDGVDAGTSGAQHHTFQSRFDPLMPVSDFFNNSVSGIRIITNRVDREHNWVLEWYSRVQNHANSHYGRTYALSGVLFNEDEGEYKVIPAAWCNLENQRAQPGQPFGENYEVDNSYSAVAPFVTQDFKVRAHCVLPSSTIYGREGFSVPASFADWNEDAHPSGTQTFDHYIPISLQKVGQKVINPRAAGNAFEDYPEGTIIAQLPILAGTGIITDANLETIVTLFEQSASAGHSGIQDVLNVVELVGAYPTLTGVAIPVQIRHRYGQVWPALWTSGTGSGTREKVVVNDSFAPWKYFPVNQKTSVDVMSERVSGLIDGQLVGVSESRFAELTKIDWPIVSFDGFANQTQISGIYGRRDHGVTEIAVSYTNGVPQTRYGIKSYFAEFGKEAPLGERNFGILNGIIHPIDFTEFNITNDTQPPPDILPIGDRTVPAPVPPVGVRKEVYAVTITQVTNRGSTTEPERYFSATKDGIPKPGGAVDPLDSLDLICRDGFFNVGDHGLYVVEYKSNSQRRRYFTGGTDLAIGSFVVSVEDVNTGAETVDVKYRGFDLTAVPLMSGVDIDNVSAGDQGKLLSDGTQRPNNEGNINGVRPDRDVPTGIWFEPASTGTTASGQATPVIIEEIADLGTSGALATVQQVVTSGVNDEPVGSGTTTGNVQPLPFAQFAQSGDLGVYLTGPLGHKYIFVGRQGFSNFGI